MGKFKFNKLKREIIPFVIAFLIIDIVIVGAFVVAAHEVTDITKPIDKIMAVLNNFLPSITSFKFFTAIFVDFAGFMKASFWTLIIFVVLFIYWKIKMSPDSDYEGIENGSSDWSKGGEEFDKLPDGSEILNRKSGFILSRKHYLGTDLRKVKINKNILVVGGSGAGKSACYIKPNILQMLGSYVITDPKGELYRETSGFLKANGYEVRAFN